MSTEAPTTADDGATPQDAPAPEDRLVTTVHSLSLPDGPLN